jgi:A/G-specific adenine glycosylase
VLTERRPDKGLLGGMMGLPTSDWGSDWTPPIFPADTDWTEVGEVHHVFTHFALVLRVWRASNAASGPMTTIADAHDALPSVFAKALKLAL